MKSQEPPYDIDLGVRLGGVMQYLINEHNLNGYKEIVELLRYTAALCERVADDLEENPPHEEISGSTSH